MASFVSGGVEIREDGKRLSPTPTPIKYLWVQTPAKNKGDVYIGNPPGPALPPGTDKEITFRHDSGESPGNLTDIMVAGEKRGDIINYLAITI